MENSNEFVFEEASESSKGKTIATGEEGTKKKSESKTGTLMGTKVEIKPKYGARRKFSFDSDDDYEKIKEKSEALSLYKIERESNLLKGKKEDSEEEEEECKEEDNEGEEENSEGAGQGGGGGNEDEEDYSGFKCLSCGKYFPDFIKLQRHKVTCHA